MIELLDIGQRRACSFAGLSRTSFREPPSIDMVTQELSARIVELAHERRRFGYRRIHPLAVATNVTHAVGLLAQAGARHFMVSNLGDLGKTPEALALGLVPQSTAATLAFNGALAASMALLDAQFLAGFGVDLDIRSLDMFALFEAVIADATQNAGATYGITNITTPCLAPVAPGAYYFPGSTDINCSVSLFSDPLHPSAAAHRLFGNLASQTLRAVPEPEPEPDSVALVLIALAALLAVSRRSDRGRGRDSPLIV